MLERPPATRYVHEQLAKVSEEAPPLYGLLVAILRSPWSRIPNKADVAKDIDLERYRAGCRALDIKIDDTQYEARAMRDLIDMGGLDEG